MKTLGFTILLVFLSGCATTTPPPSIEYTDVFIPVASCTLLPVPERPVLPIHDTFYVGEVSVDDIGRVMKDSVVSMTLLIDYIVELETIIELNNSECEE